MMPPSLFNIDWPIVYEPGPGILSFYMKLRRAFVNLPLFIFKREFAIS